MSGVMLALLGVVVLVVALFALRDPTHNPTAPATGSVAQPSSSPAGSPSGAPSQSSSRSSSRAPSPSSASSSSSAAGAMPLVVLNDTASAGLAAQAAARFRTGGWPVTSAQDNYRNDIISTAAYYDPAVPKAQVSALALQRQYRTIKRVVPKFAGLPAGPIVVVLTTDYSPN